MLLLAQFYVSCLLMNFVLRVRGLLSRTSRYGGDKSHCSSSDSFETWLYPESNRPCSIFAAFLGHD